jgi:hypothetical protein
MRSRDACSDPQMRGREVRSCVAFWCSSIIATERAAHSQRALPLRPAPRPFRACLATASVRPPGECDGRNMAPTKPTDSSLDSAQEHDEFLDTLEAYHEKRG